MSRFTLPERRSVFAALGALLLLAASLGACKDDTDTGGEPGCCQITERKCAGSPPMTPKNCQGAQGEFFPGLVCNQDTNTCE